MQIPDGFIPEDLISGTPMIEARWRLQNGALPLKNRHLRALRACGVSKGLDSWARQHIEWTLAQGSLAEPDGVLVIDVDGQGRAVMAVEPYEGLPVLSAALLLDRIAGQADKDVETEVLWVVHDGALTALTNPDKQASGVNSLVMDLAATTHLGLGYTPEPATTLLGALVEGDECFLVSDEHGVVASGDFAGPITQRFAQYYAKLLADTHMDGIDAATFGRPRR